MDAKSTSERRKESDGLGFIKFNTSVHQRTLSRKQKDSIQKESESLQIIYLIRIHYTEYVTNS